MTNLIVDVDDDGVTASSHSYSTVLQAVPGELALQPVIAGRYRHRYERARRAARDGDAYHDRSHGRPQQPHALRPSTMKLSLTYDWSCTPEEFWALYFDPDFAVRMYLESLGSTSAEIVSQEGDLTTGLVRTLRYGQKPNMPGPVRKIFGEEVITTEVSTFDPASSTSTFVMTPGTMGDKTDIGDPSPSRWWRARRWRPSISRPR